MEISSGINIVDIDTDSVIYALEAEGYYVFCYLKDALEAASETMPMNEILDAVGHSSADKTVDEIYEDMSEGQRAHMFNKLLKHEDYNAASVNLLNLEKLFYQRLKNFYEGPSTVDIAS